MIFLPPELRFALRANDINRRAADARRERHDPLPVIKLFNPVGAATWLATELADDDDTLFGLADLGFGCPELGSFSLREIASVRLPFGLGIERDIAFEGRHRLSVWTAWSRRAGSILHAEALLRRVTRPEDETDEIGPPPDASPQNKTGPGDASGGAEPRHPSRRTRRVPAIQDEGPRP